MLASAPLLSLSAGRDRARDQRIAVTTPAIVAADRHAWNEREVVPTT
jgi:hypothetical protein